MSKSAQRNKKFMGQTKAIPKENNTLIAVNDRIIKIIHFFAAIFQYIHFKKLLTLFCFSNSQSCLFV